MNECPIIQTCTRQLHKSPFKTVALMSVTNYSKPIEF